MATTRRIAIIGGGASGITNAVHLKRELGLEAQIFEKHNDYGGTWLANTYPGCACDVPSHLYSLSFEPNPYWTKRYSSQAEIQQYFKKVALKYQLDKHTLFNTEVVRATWIDADSKWKLDYRTGPASEPIQTAYFDILIAGLGPLRIPRKIDQFKPFQGKIIHTAFWDSSVDFTGKRVGLVGSGASAVQVVPELQKVAGSLHNYLRTPAWVPERLQYDYSPFMKFVFAHIPLVMLLYRWYLFLMMEMWYITFGWNDSWLARKEKRDLIKSMEDRVRNQGRPDLIEKIVPKYPLGCKRVTPSEKYLEALCQPNVTVDTSPIKEVRGRSIVTADGNEQEFDILVLATGYDVQAFIGSLEIRGKNEQTLREEWEDKFPDNYNSLAVNGYPNFFMLMGPTALLGHNSVLSMMEIQVDYVMKAVKYMLKNKLLVMEPTHKAQERFLYRLKKDFRGTVWTRGCNSWYINSKGEVTNLWSSTVTRFWYMLRKVRPSEYYITAAA